MDSAQTASAIQQKSLIFEDSIMAAETCLWTQAREIIKFIFL